MPRPYRIESATLKGIGIFENTHFEFPSKQRDANKAEIYIFTGPNGCGKSTVLYALAAIFSEEPSRYPPVSARLWRQGACDYIFENMQQRYAELSKDLTLHENNTQMLPFSSTNLRQYRREQQIHDKRPVSFAAFSYSSSRGNSHDFYIQSIEEIAISPFKDALSFERPIENKYLAQWAALNKAKTLLAEKEGDEEDVRLYKLSLRAIKEFIRDVTELDMDFVIQRKPLAVSMMIDNKILNYSVLPDGLKSILAWVIDLVWRLELIVWEENKSIFSQPIILFLDEIDIHLHPKWQRRILPAIQKLLPNAQVFVSTHSPFVVGSVEDAWVYRLPDPQRNVMRDASLPENIAPTESGAGKSIQLILEEIFDVEERFDVETENLLQKFKQVRNHFLQNPLDDSELMSLAQRIRERGEELETIIEMELRQIARRLKK